MSGKIIILERREGHSVDVQAIKNALAQLTAYRQMGQGGQDVDWEIRLYEWILNSPDASWRAEQYFVVRFPESGEVISKREVVKILGWFIE